MTETDDVDQSRADSLKQVLIRDRWRILIVLSVLTILVWYFWYQPEITREMKLFFYSFLFASLLGFVPATRIVEWLYSPDLVYLVDHDARDSDLAVWELHVSTWRDLDVTDGEVFQLRATKPAWEGKGYDPDENTCRGTWRGSASDLELVDDREKIDEIRGKLEDLAKEGIAIRVKQSSIVRSAVRNVAMRFIEGIETETVYNGDEIQRAVEDALEGYDLDDETEPKPAEDDTNDDGHLTELNLDISPASNGGPTDG